MSLMMLFFFYFVFLILLLLLWLYYYYYYCMKATTIAAFARMTVEDSKKILPAEFYPSWVVFSRRQKLTWLNHHLEKLWPYVNEVNNTIISFIITLSFFLKKNEINRILIYFYFIIN